MAFFCIVSGARIVAPGIAVSAGGNVLDYDASNPAHELAEQSARSVLSHAKQKDDSEPSPEIKVAAQRAAENVLTDPKIKAAKSGRQAP